MLDDVIEDSKNNNIYEIKTYEYNEYNEYNINGLKKIFNEIWKI